MKYLSMKDYARFQHYKDRSPPWIKLYNTLLNDFAFLQMSEAAQINLVKLWLLASRHDNAIPYNLVYITGQLQPKSALDIDELVINGFVSIVEDLAEIKKPKPKAKRKKRKALPRQQNASGIASAVSDKVLVLEETEESRERVETEEKTAIPASRGGWPAECATIWDAKVSPIEPGQCGRLLKLVVSKFGWPATKAGLEKYIIGTPEWKTPRLDLFAKEANKWVRFGPMPTTDENGDLTEWGQHIDSLTPRRRTA
jgi:hypothetical protein